MFTPHQLTKVDKIAFSLYMKGKIFKNKLISENSFNIESHINIIKWSHPI